jgi:hypothetical protein
MHQNMLFGTKQNLIQKICPNNITIVCVSKA